MNIDDQIVKSLPGGGRKVKGDDAVGFVMCGKYSQSVISFKDEPEKTNSGWVDP